MAHLYSFTRYFWLVLAMSLFFVAGISLLFIQNSNTFFREPRLYSLNEVHLNEILRPKIFPQFSSIEVQYLTVAPEYGSLYAPDGEDILFGVYSYPERDTLILEVFFKPEYLSQIREQPGSTLEVTEFFNKELVSYLILSSHSVECQNEGSCGEVKQQYIYIIP